MQAEAEIQELKALMKQNEDEIRKKEDELAAMAEIEQGWQNRAKDLAESWGDKVKEVNKQLEKERHEVLRLERLVQQLKNETKVTEMEEALQNATDRLADLQLDLDQKSAELEQTQEEFATVSEMLLRLHEDKEKIVAEAV